MESFAERCCRRSVEAVLLEDTAAGKVRDEGGVALGWRWWGILCVIACGSSKGVAGSTELCFGAYDGRGGDAVGKEGGGFVA